MKSIKVKHELRNWDDADEALRKISVAKNKIAEKVAIFNQAVETLRAEMMRDLPLLENEIEHYEGLLEAFCVANRSQIVDAQSKNKELRHGIVRFHQSPPSVALKSRLKLDDVLQKIRQSPFARIFIRQKEELDKERILQEFRLSAQSEDPQVTDLVLADLGLKINANEEFRYELKVAEVVEEVS